MMQIKQVLGIATVVLVGLGYHVLDNQTSTTSNPSGSSVLTSQRASTKATSSASAKASDTGSRTATKTEQLADANYGDISDDVPTEWLATSVLTDTVKQALHATSITYNGTGAFILNSDRTNLNAKVASAPYVHLAAVDNTGRPQAANALLSHSSREYRNRSTTGNARTIEPVGWHQLRLQNNVYVYNRGHSIGYALAGAIKGFDASEANTQNITTQTAWANQSSNGDVSNTGQNYYESLVRQTLDKSQTVKVRYRVTPIYDGHNIVPSGTHLEAKASDGSLEFNVFVPNVQPGVAINYATGFAAAAG